MLDSDFDFSPFTRLTLLGVRMKPEVRVTFPTGLKELRIAEGELTNTNIADVALETFMSGYYSRITQEELERLPKTIRKIKGKFNPKSLKDQLGEFFPLLQ